jgi:hypothetical protein
VIRRICSSDHCADGVFQVAQLWPLFQYDAVNGAVNWAKPKYAVKKTLATKGALYTVGYFGLAFAAFGFLGGALKAEPTSLLAWVCALNALLFPVLAFASLAKSEVFAAAKKTGSQWLEKINGATSIDPRSERIELHTAPTASNY